MNNRFLLPLSRHPKIRFLVDWYEFIVNRTAALYLIFIALSILNLICFPLPIAKRVKNAYDSKLAEPKNKDIFVFSAYFYDESLKNGDVSVIFFGSRGAKWERRKIFLAGSNGTRNQVKEMDIHKATPHNLCEFVTFVGSANLVENLEKLELIVSESIAQISFKPADSIPREMVVCTSPIYDKIEWQNFLNAVKIHKRFGAHVQVYFSRGTSTLFQFFQMLRVEVDSFPTEFSEKLEFGGTTVANLDCLAKYKNSASFITFLEWDEILVPAKIVDQNGGYLDVFSAIFLSQPLVGIVILKSDDRKRFVTRPDLINTVWNGKEGRRPYKMRRIELDEKRVRLQILNSKNSENFEFDIDESSKTLLEALDYEQTAISSSVTSCNQDSDVWNFDFSMNTRCNLLSRQCGNSRLESYCSSNSEFQKDLSKKTRHFNLIQRGFGIVEEIIKC